MATTHSAPEKTYLFGEHAAVYSMRAIASTINFRTIVTVAEANRTD